jgi:predicted alpha/beta-hydrolase family hydrolase
MRAGRVALCVAMIGAVSVGCSSGGSTTSSSPLATNASPTGAGAPAGSLAVRFHAPDGVALAGRLFGHGRSGIVLAHQSDDDQTAWWSFAETLRTKGYEVLTFDYRGVCPGGIAGCSKGPPDVTAAWKDVIGAVHLLRSHGARRISLVGASMGGEASIIAASKLLGTVDALVSLSGSEGFVGPLDPAVARRTVALVTAPKLFIAGRLDQGFAAYARDYFRHSRPPKRERIFDVGDHGIALLDAGQTPGIATRLVLAFLDAHR